MKRLMFFATTAFIMLSACTKDPSPTLEQTTWQYQTEISNKQYRLYLALLSPTQGYAEIIESGNNSSYGSILQVYDVRYTFDGNESGTIKFRKEYGETYTSNQTSFDDYTDTMTSTFYTYAGNNKMLISCTPNRLLHQIELTQQSYSPTKKNRYN